MKPIVILVGAVAGAAALLYAHSAGETNLTPELQAKVDELANAIAFAEGFQNADGQKLSSGVPVDYHNPGDLGPGDAPGYASSFHSGSNVVRFPDDTTGWKFLKAKLANILQGNSHVYLLDMTFVQFAQKYAGDWFSWVNNVSSYLAIDSSVTLRTWRDS